MVSIMVCLVWGNSLWHAHWILNSFPWHMEANGLANYSSSVAARELDARSSKLVEDLQEQVRDTQAHMQELQSRLPQSMQRHVAQGERVDDAMSVSSGAGSFQLVCSHGDNSATAMFHDNLDACSLSWL